MQAMVCRTPNLQDTQSLINNLCESNWLMLPLCSAGAFETQASQRKLHVVASGVFSLAGVCMVMSCPPGPRVVAVVASLAGKCQFAGWLLAQSIAASLFRARSTPHACTGRTFQLMAHDEPLTSLQLVMEATPIQSTQT
jgi:hypothetical protein